MKFKNIWLVVLGIIFLIACGENDPVPSNSSQVSIIGFEFILPPSSTDGRTLQNTFWNHPLQTSIDLKFESLNDGMVYPFTINPNQLENAPELFLPFGTYRVTANTNVLEIADFLPFRVEDEIQISNPITELTLKGQTNFGLFTVGVDEVRIAPNSGSGQLTSSQGYYFLYAKPESTLSIELSPKQGEISFLRNWEPNPLAHEIIDLVYPQEEGEDTFTTPGFRTQNVRIRIDEEGYPQNLNPLPSITLPLSQEENSGLAYIESRIFSINDGGNSPEIYELDPSTGQVVRTITVEGAINSDWEDLAQSSSHLFIGDFGNNDGTRTDLNILKISWAELLAGNNASTEKLSFTYPDQTDFSGLNPNHDFDCEAFFFSDGLLHLFTKNRIDQKTNHYTLDVTSQNQIAKKINSFSSDGLITGADINSATQTITLLGYKLNGLSSQSFIWVLKDYPAGDYLSGKSKRFEIGSPLELGQTEGIVFDSEESILISAEGIQNGGLRISPNLMKLNVKGIF